MPDAAFRILVVAESEADLRTAASLADRLLCDRVDWIDDGSLADHREYCGLHSNQSFIRWASVEKEADVPKIRGRFGNVAAPGDFKTAERVLRWIKLKTKDDPPAAIFLMRDTDGQHSLADVQGSLDRARKRSAGSVRTILAVSHPKREAWVLNAFEPADAAEKDALEEQTRELGHDPRTHAHELTARSKGAKRDVKAILDALIGNNSDREQRCLRDADWAELEQRGAHTGLRDFLGEIQERFIPLFGGQPG